MKKIYNKLMSIIFSQSTPIQLLLVSILGFVFGFIPGFGYAPFLFILVIFLVLTLRVSIGLFVLIAMIAKLLSYPLEGVSFTLGRWLLDGFAQPIFKAAVNTPVLAYAGFDYYLVTGGFVIALILGVIFGAFIGKSYKRFINKMASLQAGSEIYQKITGKLTTKIASKIVFGKNISKVDWQKIQARKFRQPIRIWGTLIVIILVVAVAFSPKILETALVSNIIKQQLTKANGATVDYDSLKLSLSDANLEINGLGAADPSNLNKDRFYAKNISASVDVSGLLTKRIALKNVVVEGVSLDRQRDTTAKLYSDNPNEANTSITKAEGAKIAKQQAIDSIKAMGGNIQQVDIQKIANNAEKTADVAKGIKQGVEFLSNFKSSASDKTSAEVANEVKQEAKVYGYANVKNESLQDKAPSFAIQNMAINNYENSGTIYNANITNLSTNPALLAKATTIDVKSINNNDVTVNVVISNQPNVDNTVKFDLQDVAGNAMKGLTIQGVGLEAENLNISGNGTWQFNDVNNVNFTIPLTLTLQNVGVNFNNIKQKISNLTLKAVISGNLDNVGFGIDTSFIKDVLNIKNVQETAKQIAKQTGLDKKAQQLLDKAKINGKSIQDLNANDLSKINKKDVQNLASQFGIKIN